MKIIKNILISLILIFTLSACQNQDTIKNYNQISQEHNDKLSQATENFKGAIDNYNSQKYDEVIVSTNLAKEEFENAKNLSVESKDLAKNIKGKEWLADFKEIYLQMEDIKIQQCNLLIKSAQAAKNKDNAGATEAINQMSELNNKYNQMQKTLADIKSQHPKDFQ